jgi:hypothetical protein
VILKMIDLTGVKDHVDLLSRVMTAVSGPMLSGNTLSEALGYDSTGAVRQARLRNMLPVSTFGLPSKHQKFAFSAEVAKWLIEQRESNSPRPIEINLEFIKSNISMLRLFIIDHGYLLEESQLVKHLKLEDESAPIQTYYLDKQPYALFRIDNRHAKRFALSIEVFPHINSL